jgi:hypothetical protein
MCESQLIGFSMSETTVLAEMSPKNLITVWYRAQKRDSEVPMKELKFKFVDASGASEAAGWGGVNDEPKKAEYTNRKVLGVVCSPQVVNNRCNMVVFYNDDVRALKVQYFTDFDDKIETDEMEAKACIGPMNSRFMPHELVSITIYEEDHPNSEDGLSTSITHYSPPSRDQDPCYPDTIAERMPNKETEVRPNYSYKLIEKTAAAGGSREALWDEVHAAALDYINNLDDAGCKVATFNRSKDKATGQIADDACAVIISWDRNAAENIAEQMRPSGCCNIF